MRFITVRTRVLQPPKDDLHDVLDSLPLQDGDVVCISSKVLAIHQGRCVPIEGTNKEELIAREAQHVFRHPHYKALSLTIKEHTLVPAAGIDASNGNGYYVLWPKDTDTLLKEFTDYLKRKHHIKRLALIATDSTLLPMRAGVVGVSIGLYGLEPLHDYRKEKDIFGRPLSVTQTDIADGLAAAAVLCMGEGNEQQPIVIVRDAGVVFTDRPTRSKLVMPPENDLYGPLLK